MKDVIGYEGLYAVTSCGKVWSYKSKKFLKPIKRTDGYLQVNLYKDGQQKTSLVHRLVTEAYILNPNNLPQVNHKNEIKTINHVNNLEWVSAKDNINYGSHNERSAASRSKPVYCVELDKTFQSGAVAARELNLSYGNISSCCVGRRHTTGGYHFQFAEVC